MDNNVFNIYTHLTELQIFRNNISRSCNGEVLSDVSDDNKESEKVNVVNYVR